MSYQLEAGSNIELFPYKEADGGRLMVSSKVHRLYIGNRIYEYQFNDQVAPSKYQKFDIVLTYGGGTTTTVTVYPDFNSYNNGSLGIPVQYIENFYDTLCYTLFMCRVSINGDGITVSDTLVYNSGDGTYSQAGKLLGISAIYGVER